MATNSTLPGGLAVDLADDLATGVAAQAPAGLQARPDLAAQPEAVACCRVMRSKA
ncbi:MAG: hypothetical protein Q8P60_15195 [Pseudorhodobacter sp.]|nr:hypothetical protein [Pseudorhodobacter sp.]